MNIEQYFKRLQLPYNVAIDYLDIEGLRQIQRNHLLNIPFENLDLHLGRELNLQTAVLFDKLIVKRRGGICYELNYLLCQFLKALGFSVSILGGCVLEDIEGASLSDYDHLFLKVMIEKVEYLVDVGFGDNYLGPLEFTTGKLQEDPKGVFTIERIGHNRFQLYKISDSKEKVYSFENTNRELTEFYDRMNWITHSGQSIFTRNKFCSLEKLNGRISLKEDKLIETINDEKCVTEIGDMGLYLKYLEELFGIQVEKSDFNK
jgi:N-hydroxyarylamine O-acetyltransferase